jgi:probable HAF family extracellular repeat protein
MTDLGVLPGGVHSTAFGINDRGDVVGNSETGDGQHAVLWRNGRLVDLGADAVDLTGSAYGVNNAGVIVGTWGDGTHESLAVRWSSTGRRTLLSTERSVAYSVNDRGHILGAFRTGTGYDDGFLLRDGRFTKVAPPAGLRTVNLSAVNDRDQVVGTAYAGGDSGFEATIWSNGTAATLPKLGTHAQAYDVNDQGQVAGSTTTGADGWITRAVLWVR